MWEQTVKKWNQLETKQKIVAIVVAVVLLGIITA